MTANLASKHPTMSVPGPRPARTVAARLVAETMNPPVAIAVAAAAVACATAPTLAKGLLWGAPAVMLGGVLPMVFILAGVRRGRLTDHHIRRRGQRRIPLLFALGCMVADLGYLAAVHASRPLVLLLAALVATLAPCIMVTEWWQISLHTGILAAILAVFTVVWGPILAVVWPLVVVVGWSRLRLGAHTLAQLAAGTALGVGAAAAAAALVG